jgi:hypothetical protein
LTSFISTSILIIRRKWQVWKPALRVFHENGKFWSRKAGAMIARENGRYGNLPYGVSSRTEDLKEGEIDERGWVHKRESGETQSFRH